MQPGGLLLTGGASSRMGRDKATLVFRGETLARRAARTLRSVASPVLVVGAEAGTGLTVVDDPRSGPLAAVVAGASSLPPGPVLVLACDMPFVTASLLGLLAASPGSFDAAVPIAAGREQPLCACYAAPALVAVGRGLLERGERSMRALLGELAVQYVSEDRWRAVAPAYAFDDLDTPAEFDAASGRDDADRA